MPALADFLRAVHSGHTTMTPEMYAHFGGDKILAEVQKFDPSAKWTDTSISGGEGGEGQAGKRLDFDITKMPKPKNSDLLNARVVADNDENLLNKKYKWDDESYGSITDSKNVNHHVDFLDKYGPMLAALAISVVAPAAAPALFGAMSGGALGAAALGAGFTSGVTGAAAGLAPGAIPGALGAGSSLGLSDSLLQMMGKSPQTIGRQISNRQPNYGSMLPMMLRLLGK